MGYNNVFGSVIEIIHFLAWDGKLISSFNPCPQFVQGGKGVVK